MDGELLRTFVPLWDRNLNLLFNSLIIQWNKVCDWRPLLLLRHLLSCIVACAINTALFAMSWLDILFRLEIFRFLIIESLQKSVG